MLQSSCERHATHLGIRVVQGVEEERRRRRREVGDVLLQRIDLGSTALAISEPRTMCIDKQYDPSHGCTSLCDRFYTPACTLAAEAVVQGAAVITHRLAVWILCHKAVVIDRVHKALLGDRVAEAPARRVPEADAPVHEHAATGVSGAVTTAALS